MPSDPPDGGLLPPPVPDPVVLGRIDRARLALGAVVRYLPPASVDPWLRGLGEATIRQVAVGPLVRVVAVPEGVSLDAASAAADGATLVPDPFARPACCAAKPPLAWWPDSAPGSAGAPTAPSPPPPPHPLLGFSRVGSTLGWLPCSPACPAAAGEAERTLLLAGAGGVPRWHDELEWFVAEAASPTLLWPGGRILLEGSATGTQANVRRATAVPPLPHPQWAERDDGAVGDVDADQLARWVTAGDTLEVSPAALTSSLYGQPRATRPPPAGSAWLAGDPGRLPDTAAPWRHAIDHGVQAFGAIDGGLAALPMVTDGYREEHLREAVTVTTRGDDLQVEIQLGHLCNNLCVFCVSGQLTQDRKAAPLQLEPIERALQDAAARGIRRVTLLGGEPTIQRGFLDVLRRARALGFEEIVVFTNGVRGRHTAFLEEVVAVGGISWRFSIQGGSEEAHDRVTGRPGSFAKLAAGARWLRDRGQDLTANLCVNEHSYRSLPGFPALVQELGMRQLHLDAIRPSGAGKRTASYLRSIMPRVSDAAPWFGRMFEAFDAALPGFDVTVGNLPYCALPEHADRIHHGGEMTLTVVAEAGGGATTWNKYHSQRSDQVFGPGCGDCVFRAQCRGVPEAYARYFGTDELRPVSVEELRAADPAGRTFAIQAAALIEPSLGQAAVDGWRPARVFRDVRERRVELSFVGPRGAEASLQLVPCGASGDTSPGRVLQARWFDVVAPAANAGPIAWLVEALRAAGQLPAGGVGSTPAAGAGRFDAERRTLITKTWHQLNHELPIPLYEPLPGLDKRAAWARWLQDPAVPAALRRDLGLYVHVPYCVQVCSFCYLEKRLLDATMPTWLERLEAEARAYAPVFAGVPLRTLYLGGGTPGALSAANLERLFGALRSSFDLDRLAEWSIESDLPSLTAGKLQVLKAHGVTRLSVGLQNLDEAALAANNRLFAFDIESRLELLREHRFDGLNLDVIVGIPGSTLENVERTVRAAVALRPTRVSLYTFNPYSGYAFDFTDTAGAEELIRRREEQIELARRLVREAGQAGLLQDRDNLQLEETVTRHAPLLGLGPSANNRLPLHLYFKNPGSDRYLTDPDEVRGYRPSGPGEELDFFLYNNLVRSQPIDLRRCRALFGRAPSDVFRRCEELVSGPMRLDGALASPALEDPIELHLRLLRGLEAGRRQVRESRWPTAMEGVDLGLLSRLMVGY